LRPVEEIVLRHGALMHHECLMIQGYYLMAVIVNISLAVYCPSPLLQADAISAVFFLSPLATALLTAPFEHQES